MRIVALEPFLTDLVCSLGLRDSLVGRSRHLPADDRLEGIEVLTVSAAEKVPIKETEVGQLLSQDVVLTDLLISLEPDVVLTSLQAPEEQFVETLQFLRQELSAMLQKKVKVFSYNPFSLDSIYEMLEQLGKDLGAAAKGRELAQLLKAQFMDWCDNFYDRLKGKKVSFISAVEPLRLGGWWIPDMIKMASAEAQLWSSGKEGPLIQWQDLLQFRPDVLLIAPQGVDLQQAARLFMDFEKRPGWLEIPAVIRGEVYFTEGVKHFYRPSMELIESMSILVSAIAGFESGYITPRDSFYPLRWLELQRHRYMDA